MILPAFGLRKSEENLMDGRMNLPLGIVVEFWEKGFTEWTRRISGGSKAAWFKPYDDEENLKKSKIFHKVKIPS